jgi:hypothetical protein
VLGGYRTLSAAQAALTGELAVVPQAGDASDARGISATLLLCTTVAMLCSVALSTVGIAVLR